jgi:hypothetical protein
MRALAATAFLLGVSGLSCGHGTPPPMVPDPPEPIITVDGGSAQTAPVAPPTPASSAEAPKP